MDNDPYATPPPLPERTIVQQPAQCRAPGRGMWFLQSCLVAGCATIIVPFALVFGFFGFLYFLASDSISEGSNTLDSIYSSGTGSTLREKVIRPGLADSTIVLVKIHGTIAGDGSTLEGDGMLAQVSEELRNAAEDDRVLAVLLQIDSPGGGLTASDQLHNEIQKVKKAGKTVVAWAGDTMASGGYYIAAACDGIMASPTCTVGSIGVLLQHFQVEGLLQKLGVKVDPVAAGEHKTMGSPFRDMTPEERKILQDLVDVSHRRFIDIVADGRGMPRERVEKLADGSVFVPRDALDNGLIDKIGYVDEAVAWIEEKIGKSDMRVISYRRLMSLNDIFREAGRGVTSAVVESSATGGAPKAMAIWRE